MNHRAVHVHPSADARPAGVACLVIITTGIFAEFFVRSRVIVWGDAAATAANITGLQCGVLAYLILKSGYVPKALGVLLMFAAFGYLADSFGRTLLASYTDYEVIFSIVVFAPAFLGELCFALWLLFRGVDVADAEA